MLKIEAKEKPNLSVKEASQWVSAWLKRDVTPSNISYLLNYGRIDKAANSNGETRICIDELKRYYESWLGRRETNYKQKLGNDLNWRLSFEEYKESDTTKHVHRLHPYKGKFIPQLVKYFLDSHTDDFKTASVFKPQDILLDPFCGSGTTLVQANELGMHAVGVDISCFNAMISNLKLCHLSADKITEATKYVEKKIENEPLAIKARIFESALLAELKEYNNKYFPSPEFRRKLRTGGINEGVYGKQKAREFLSVYKELMKKFDFGDIYPPQGGFLDTWYLPPVRHEIMAAARCIERRTDSDMQNMLRLILSRTIRSARATTHYDLATLIKPVVEPYYCGKHGKICKPLFSLLGWWRRYSKDTVARLEQFSKLRSDTRQFCLSGDARELDLFATLKNTNKGLSDLAKKNKIRGIFSSPPYVGLINYHEQHAYAYELFKYPNNEKKEIGIMQKGQGVEARKVYVRGIADVLINCRRFMVRDYDVFLVANDKFGLYPQIAELSGMRVVKEYKRPVLNRAEGNKGAYGESIFHMRSKNVS